MKLAEFKGECKKALAKNDLAEYNAVIARGKQFSFEIYEYAQCKKARKQLSTTRQTSKNGAEELMNKAKDETMGNAKIIGNLDLMRRDT